MANVIIKSEQRRADELRVAETFGVNMNRSEGREYVEHIAARSREAYNAINKMEGK